MIPYEELDRALARWKARTHGGAAAEAPAPVIEAEASASVTDMEAEEGDYAATPGPAAVVNGRPHPPDRTGEISLEEEVLETYDDDQ
jgi:hypothetical protein